MCHALQIILQNELYIRFMECNPRKTNLKKNYRSQVSFSIQNVSIFCKLQFIQGESGGSGNILGGDSMGQDHDTTIKDMTLRRWPPSWLRNAKSKISPGTV
jgi:hypothetical protein